MAEYVYILQVREFIATGKNIYKIGKSKQPNLCRVNNYPKFSVLIMQTLCIDCDILEKQIIKLFNEKYKKQKDYGNEYYEGNLVSMVADINELVAKQFKEHMNGVNGVFKIQYKKDTNIAELVKEVKKTKTEKKKEEEAAKIREEAKAISNKIKNVIGKKSNKITICPKCNKEFKYPSILKIHLKDAFHCKMSDEEIDNLLYKKQEGHKCSKCDKTFCNIKALNRHNRETKCGKDIVKDNEVKELEIIIEEENKEEQEEDEENKEEEEKEEDEDEEDEEQEEQEEKEEYKEDEEEELEEDAVNIIKIKKNCSFFDRKCPNDACNYLFKYPSGLKRHFQISVRCHKAEEEIKNYFLELEKEKTNKTLECNICKQSFSNKSNLIRHETTQHSTKNNSISNIDLNILKNNKTKLLEILNKL